MSEATHQMPTPGAEHDLLKPFVGRFRTTVKLYMGPGDPMVQHGTMLNSFQLGGLYLHQDYTGDPTPGPFPSFLGRGYWGYNPYSKVYEGFWIDNASSVMQVESGSVDQSGKVWTMVSRLTHPGSGKPMVKKSEIRLIDGDHHSMVTTMTIEGGPEIRTMEIEYARVT